MSMMNGLFERSTIIPSPDVFVCYVLLFMRDTFDLVVFVAPFFSIPSCVDFGPALIVVSK